MDIATMLWNYDVTSPTFTIADLTRFFTRDKLHQFVWGKNDRL